MVLYPYSSLRLKLKLRVTKKNMAAIVYQLLTQCFINADASPDDEDTTTSLR